MKQPRDQYGRYVKRPRRSDRQPDPPSDDNYLSVTIKTVPLDRWSQVIERALADAEKGDNNARKFLADYLLVKPKGENQEEPAVEIRYVRDKMSHLLARYVAGADAPDDPGGDDGSGTGGAAV